MNQKFVFLIFFFISYLKYSIIKCLNEFICKSDFSLNNFEENDTLLLDPGKMHKINLTNDKSIKFNIEKPSNLYVNIFSIDCKIEIEEIESTIINDIFSFILNNERNPFKIHLNKDNDSRNCALIINSIYENTKQLEVEEMEPTILYFDKNLDTIKLSYNNQNSNFITFSFLFNNFSTFRISCKDNNILISNSYNLFLSDLDKMEKIDINIKLMDKNKYPVIMKFKIFTNSSTPLIAQRNYLNQGFITSNLAQRYYYMEVFEDEEGEIIFHDKRQYGRLYGKICSKNNCSNENLFIKDDSFNLEYR